MEKPEMCPENVYEIMKECWNLEPGKRPSMTDICKRINAMYRVYAKSSDLDDKMSVNNNNEDYYKVPNMNNNNEEYYNTV